MARADAKVWAGSRLLLPLLLVLLHWSQICTSSVHAQTLPAFLQKETGHKLAGSIFGSNLQVEGTQCSVDVVEAANAEQLHSILQELAKMTYFRLIRVNVDQPCTVLQDRKLADAGSHDEEHAPSTSTSPAGIGSSGLFDGGQSQLTTDDDPADNADDGESCGEEIETE